MWVIFVLIGVLFFNRNFYDVYTSQVTLKLLLNLLGFQQYFGYYGYNPTWWFISAILALSVLHQLDQKIIYPHYDFKHLTKKYFEIGMKLRNG